ncbi:MAG: protein kinase, partial [Pyrinomonadaceae bacterium]
MEVEHWHKVSRIFNSAIELDAERRLDFVDEECGGNEALKAEVQALISAHESFDSFIDSPIGSEGRGEPVKSLQPGERIASFQILSHIGSGAMGEVYLAKDLRLNRHVAIKVLPPNSAIDEGSRKRFQREAQSAASLDHPNICTIHEIGEHSGFNFIVMQYV